MLIVRKAASELFVLRSWVTSASSSSPILAVSAPLAVRGEGSKDDHYYTFSGEVGHWGPREIWIRAQRSG